MQKILAIDDKMDNLISLSALLKNLMPDCPVITALSGREGIEKAKAELPDAILLDVKMPDMDGFETCRRLKADEITKRIPVIMITAIKMDSPSRIKGLEVGADAFLAKPMDEAELASQIKVALRIKKAEDALRRERDSLEKTVSERVAALAEGEERRRTILRTAMDGFWLVDMQGRLVEVNETYCRMSGYSEHELLAMRIPDLEAAETGDDTTAHIQKIMAQGEDRFESRHRRKDGSIYDVEVSVQYRSAGGGQFVVFLRDITESKRAEESLRVSHRFLEIANRQMEIGPLLKEFVVEVQKFAQCAAVGIRMLEESGDIPYEAYVGFSERFYKLESPLSIKSDRCMCINVIKGVTDPKDSFYTKGGSFYMNGTTRFLATVSEEEKGLTRNVCNEVGYESVALVPVRAEGRIIGLIHLADLRENMVPLRVVEVLESAAMQLGTAIQRVRREEQKREQERLNQIMLDSLPCVALLMRPKTREIVAMNKVAKEAGCSLGHTCFGTWPKLEQPCSWCLATKVWTDGQAQQLEVEALGVTWDAHWDPISDDLYLHYAFDITELKRAEKILRKSMEEAKRFSQENALIAEIGRIIGSTLNIEDVFEGFSGAVAKLIPFDRIQINLNNPQKDTTFVRYTGGIDIPKRRVGEYVSLAGSGSAECIRTKSSLLIQPKDVKELEEAGSRFPALLPTFESGIRSIVMAPLIYEDEIIGTLSLRSAKTQAYTDQDVRLLESIASQIAGAVANARLFEERERMEAELLKSEERYRRLVELSPLMIMVHQQEKYVYANPAAVKALGASSADELLGKSIYEVIHPEYRNIVKERILALERGEGNAPLEEKFIRFDKEVIDVEVTNVQTLYQDATTILIIGRDITEQKKGEKEKVALQEKLQQAQKMEAIGTLAGGIAHDFNNILTAIMGYAELADLDLAEESKTKRNLQQSIKSAHRAKELVKQILAFSRQGKQERKPLDVRPIVKEGLKFLRASLPATIEVRQSFEDDLPIIEADPTQVYQILMNLCTNAAHAMEEKGGGLEVSLEQFIQIPGKPAVYAGMELGPYLKLRVSDTGHGIPPDILPRIFEPYFTTKEVGKGTGLGLAVAHGIVKSYGGGVTVSSELGKGTTVEVYIPRVESPKEHLTAEQREPLPLGGHEKILFVDDEADIADIARGLLGHLGYEVEVRTSSIEAREMFLANPDRFDLVITDMTMPNMTGDRLAQEILGIRPGIPIILCTGFSERITEEKAKAMGIQEFAMKPLVMKDLAVAIRRALDRKKKKKG